MLRRITFFLSNWFHKETLPSEEPFCFTYNTNYLYVRFIFYLWYAIVLLCSVTHTGLKQQVHDDMMFIFGWTIRLTAFYKPVEVELSFVLTRTNLDESNVGLKKNIFRWIYLYFFIFYTCSFFVIWQGCWKRDINESLNPLVLYSVILQVNKPWNLRNLIIIAIKR